MTEFRLVSEYLHTPGDNSAEVVLLHGWASSREIWRPLVAEISAWANVTLVDLPGCSDSNGDFSLFELRALEGAIFSIAPLRAIYIGWSLGGQLASCLALSQPAKVSALVTVCSNPKFIAQDDWPGIAPDDYKLFRQSVEENVMKALRRFDVLQASGAEHPKAIARELQGARLSVNTGSLIAGLDLLASLDTRQTLGSLPQPQMHFIADQDALVPQELKDALDQLLPNQLNVRLEFLSGVSHAAPVDVPAQIAAALSDFLIDAKLLDKGRRDPEEPDKAEIANSFSKAACRYDSAAQLQKEVGTSLLESAQKEGFEPRKVLDLGCGTAFFLPALAGLFPHSDYLGLDLAPGMIEFSRGRFPGRADWLVADAENLPLAEASIDLVFSSLAIQWCHSPSRLFSELGRILVPGGRCVFTSLGPDTLKELRSSWAAVDSHQHVNSFLELRELGAAAAEVEGISVQLRSEFFVMEYDRVGELLHELKTIGAHNMNRKRQTGLTGRRALQGMLGAYENWRKDGKLPATYEVVFGTLEKL